MGYSGRRWCGIGLGGLVMLAGLRNGTEKIAPHRKTKKVWCVVRAARQDNGHHIQVRHSPVVASSRHSTTSVASLFALHWLEMWPQYWEKRPSKEPTCKGEGKKR
jgi:hypothetical protein